MIVYIIGNEIKKQKPYRKIFFYTVFLIGIIYTEYKAA